MQEVKAGQKWKSNLTGYEYIVDKVCAEGVHVFRRAKTALDKSGFDGETFELVKNTDSELSDLEIVQNALSLEDVELTLGTGGSSTFVTNDYKESVCYFANNAELLAWAKQRLGVE